MRAGEAPCCRWANKEEPSCGRTKHGKAPPFEVDKAIDGIKALRKRIGKITLDELLSARHKGHK
jgi:hypothetical protein